MRPFLVSILILGLAQLVGAKAFAFDEPGFPRTGGINMSSPYNYNDPAYQAALAKLDLAIIKTYPGRPSWDPAIKAIKKINPNALLFIYVNSNELGETAMLGGGTAWDAYRKKLDTMKWWLYTTEGSGTRVQSTFGPNYYIINNTPNTQRDSSGYTSIEWIARFFVDNYYKKNSSIDGFFMDNTFWKPAVDGDWNRDGKTEAKTDAAAGASLRKGYASYFSTVRTLMPGKFQLGNIGALGETDAVFPEYKDLMNGGVIEGVIGKSWSVEGYGGWQTMMARYRKVMGAVIAPKLVIFNQWGDPKDYRAARYGIASCLMDDGYHSFTDTAKGFTGVVWFDEYNAKLGQPVSEPPTKAWSAGVYRRDFENGIALVNPKGNGAHEVTLETDYIALKGTQDTTVNNGRTVRKLTIGDRDGVILMRKVPVKRPKAPVVVGS